MGSLERSDGFALGAPLHVRELARLHDPEESRVLTPMLCVTPMLCELSESTKRKILYDNVKEFYRI